MAESFFFSHIPRIHFGSGKFREIYPILEKVTHEVIILTGEKSFTGSPHMQTFMEFMERRKVGYHHIIINREPSPDMIDRICRQFRGHLVDLVVSIGGGSVTDAGKAVSAMLKLNESVMEYLEGAGNGKLHSGMKVPFIAVPTTSGTGSEATKNAVLSHTGISGYKRSLRHDNFVPDAAIVDPELTLSCPRHITAACGMDAFTQLLESYVSTQANPMTDAMAYSGLLKIKESLIPACNNGTEDIKAREGMAYASLVSGITLANAGLGVVHGFASSVGGLFDIPHGVICGSLLGPATRMNIKKLLKEKSNAPALKKHADAGRLFTNVNSKEDAYYLDVLQNIIDEWTQLLGIPALKDYGVTSADIGKIVDQTGIKYNPVKLAKDDLMEILEERI